MTNATENVQQYIGQSLFDDDGTKIGKIGAVFLDDATGQPQWVTVATGFFGTNESVVPVAEASAREDGLAVPYSKDTVKAAPNVDIDSGRLSTEEETNLYRYYGLDPAPDVPAAADLRADDRGADGVPADHVPADDVVPDVVLPEDVVVTEDVAPDAVPAPDGVPPQDDASNVGRTDLVQRDADYDDSDATGMSAGPTNRHGTEIHTGTETGSGIDTGTETLDRPRTE